MDYREISLLAEQLSAPSDYIPEADNMSSSPASLETAVRLFRDLVFPGYFTDTPMIEALSALQRTLAALIDPHLVARFMQQLPELRRLLATDVKAVYDGDPAAESYEEVILCYPAIKALTHYRMAHALHTLGVRVFPRILTELAHSMTGIDIHPGAQIGESFSMDHGTGIVIGETCIIGRQVRLYQGVTLGAKSFREGDDGKLLNVPRHPIIEDRVTIYSNSSILGRITIGHDSIVGGNIWLSHDLPPYSRIVQRAATKDE